MTIVVVGLRFAMCPLVGGEPDAAKATRSEGSYTRVKTLFDAMRSGTFSETAVAAETALIELAPEILPELRRLFHEDRDDSRKSGYIGIMFANPASISEAVQFVKDELAKPVSQWRGRLWISQAFRGLEKHDPAAARWASLRALEHQNEGGVVADALTVMVRVGQPEDVPELQRFKATRGVDPTSGNGRRNVLLLADHAINAINARAQGETRPVSSQSGQASVLNGHAPADAVLRTAAEDIGLAASQSQFPWWAVLGTIVLVILVYVILRRLW